MLYAVLSEDVADSLEKRNSVSHEHLARIQKLNDQGRLLVAGPHPAIDNEEPGPAGFSGSLVIAEFESLEEAQAWADSDPFIIAGVYQNVKVKPFKQVLP
jgi:uncharacterized protein YciI